MFSVAGQSFPAVKSYCCRVRPLWGEMVSGGGGVAASMIAVATWD